MTKKVRIIGVPIDLGQSHRGVDMGPSAMRYAGLIGTLKRQGYKVKDNGDIDVISHYTLRNTSLDKRIPHIAKTSKTVYHIGKKAVRQKEIPVFLGGDHSVAIGSIGGVTHDEPCGLIWIDAHGDFNTPDSSPSGNVHGMGLATLLGYGPPELVNVGRHGPKIKGKDVVLIGIRDLDEKEKLLLKQSNCTVYTMREVDEYGIHIVLREALKKLSNHKRIHVSFDIDSIDPMEAPGVGTPVRGGLTYREGQLVMEIIADTKKLCSVDLVEINPILDTQNRTAQIAVSLVASLFGKSIL